ncbi:MAG: NAD-binding protein [Sulfuricaulis sp.]|uniref:potassium channel family protein n=1 Tax=Sulfuricaulis sp. TaxID=2003553 RepID=UPI0025CF6E59|nr:NAD-binding protein [Sulfuricaulis sp.]MCR4348226.1 NAD-binding protein [Sulfuricaulis sp.]
MKNTALFIILRRMRVPLLALIASYAVSMLGLVLIPGIEVDGRPQYLSFFHAFYIMTYTATTTGFGELPVPFSDAQRLWVTISLYISVVAWLYAIGALIMMLRDQALRQLIDLNRFAAQVKRLNEPFYIVCGYGDTGSVVGRSMIDCNMGAVAIDKNQDRLNELMLENLPVHVPHLCGDASLPSNLISAGLNHPQCRGVLALCEDDLVNLRIAITCRLLSPGLSVICRAQSHDTEANMHSFGTDAVINPFDTFADRLALALHSPDMHLIYEWLTGIPDAPLPERLHPPHGTWVVCGYGRFGKAVQRYLEFEGVPMVIVESDPEKTEAPKNVIIGRGTEAVTLRAANIEKAVGIVAGTDDDANNLSIIVTARELNSKLFLVARQNDNENDAVFQAARLDLVMQRARAISRRILAIITAPLLTDFLRLMRHQKTEWAQGLIEYMRPLLGGVTPVLWTVAITEEETPAVEKSLQTGVNLSMSLLLLDPHDRDQRLQAMALMMKRGKEEHLLPEDDMELKPGDKILFCGCKGMAALQHRTLFSPNVVHYLVSGETIPDGTIWRWFAHRGG